MINMTIVELYDTVNVENIVGAMICAPERVVLIGDDVKKINKSIERYKKVLAAHGIEIELIAKRGSRNSLQYVVDVLTEIVNEYGECVFDITGGNELYLVAVGMIMRDFAGLVQCHKFDFKKSTFTDCDADGNVVNHGEFVLSIADNIALYGGEIVWDYDNGEFVTYKWDLNESFGKDVEAMWEICEDNPRLWNAQMNYLGALYERYGDGLTLKFNLKEAESSFKRKPTFIKGIFSSLNMCGVISEFFMTDDDVSITFKNEQCLKTLTVAGQVLELYVAYRLLRMKESENSEKPFFDDIMVGVVIDWSDSEEDDNVINEIDVIAMKDGIPMFISCKNGAFKNEELYKLYSVSDRFGADYTKKVLVLPDAELLDNGEELAQRMEKMGIRRFEMEKGNGDKFENYVRSLM